MLPLLSLTIGILVLLGQCMANTETYLMRVPLYFNIPPHLGPVSADARLNRDLHHINHTHALLTDYPIGHIGGIQEPISNIIEVPYDTLAGFSSKKSPWNTLLVRINNYQDSSYSPRDLLSVKVCWPTTYPYDFTISHRFLKDSELGLSSDDKQLALYVQVDFQFRGQTFDPTFLSADDSVVFQLYVNRLPSRYIPIPLELYPFIVYFVDLIILLVQIVPVVAQLIW
ncbi:uncharacterized protein CANTADRAFT_53384 [Suhomyces tanzawaensis NRRL Y-17324]|uniref:Uncharacterized protein n=1 Tax=Suhomyces tanzawaensis NRRL Y-17324 TaxID=984487 RepID=A0A1E4SG26_9ASCO|nr:uncharacterized protein CANTADRAFT_53384 [Suhomyces tanzawaensis NRRL Y-17324]ODV78420.1 hypothetical protein CANTADRAFT_53384 [Suhomyces tanzawaensis NRRL Y-17324]